MKQAPKRGDVILLDFDPQAGTEQKKRRPALVVSEEKFNSLGLAVVCPITSIPPRHGFHVKLPKSMITRGCVMTEQVKSLDFQARNFEFIEKSPLPLLHKVRGILHTFL